MDTKERLGQRIRALRERAGMSQAALAAAAGLNRVFVGALERGEHAASVDTLERVARALGVTLPSLVTLGGERESASPVDLLLRRVQLLARDAPPAELERFGRIAREYFRRAGAAKKAARRR